MLDEYLTLLKIHTHTKLIIMFFILKKNVIRNTVPNTFFYIMSTLYMCFHNPF